MPVLLGQFVGALVPTFLLSRLLLWVTKKWDGGLGRYFAVHLGSLLIAALIGGMGRADGGAFAPIEAAGVYAIPQVIWLVVDLVQFNARSRAASAQPATKATDAEMMFWQSIKESTNPADFGAYLQQFPSGVFAHLARNRLGAIGGTPIDVPPPNGAASLETPNVKNGAPRGFWIVAAALGFAIVLGSLLVGSALDAMNASDADVESERAKYDRWLAESRAAAAHNAAASFVLECHGVSERTDIREERRQSYRRETHVVLRFRPDAPAASTIPPGPRPIELVQHFPTTSVGLSPLLGSANNCAAGECVVRFSPESIYHRRTREDATGELSISRSTGYYQATFSYRPSGSSPEEWLETGTCQPAAQPQ